MSKIKISFGKRPEEERNDFRDLFSFDDKRVVYAKINLAKLSENSDSVSFSFKKNWAIKLLKNKPKIEELLTELHKLSVEHINAQQHDPYNYKATLKVDNMPEPTLADISFFHEYRFDPEHNQEETIERILKELLELLKSPRDNSSAMTLNSTSYNHFNAIQVVTVAPKDVVVQSAFVDAALGAVEILT